MPSLRERFGAWIAGRAATQPIAFHTIQGQSIFPGGLGNQPSKHLLLQESMGLADAASRTIANRVASLDPQVIVSRGAGGTLDDEILDDHPLKILLDSPHPDFSRFQLLRITVQHLTTVGEAYWLKVNSDLGVPAELHPIPPTHIDPILERGRIVAYVTRDGEGQRTELARDVVVRFFFPDPEFPWRGEGYLGPSALTADALKFANQHLRRHYQIDATPKMALKADEKATPFTREEKEAFQTLWRDRYHSRFGSSEGAPAILPTGYDLVELAMQTGADVTPLLQHWRDEQLMAFGIPRSVLGQVVSGDRSSAETNEWVFDRHTIMPITQLIQDSLTTQLARDFDSEIFVRFAGFVSEDKEYELRRERQDLELKVKSINQILQLRGDDPVAWGEIPVGTNRDRPYDGTKPEPMAIDSEKIDSDESMPSNADRPRAARTRRALRRRSA